MVGCFRKPEELAEKGVIAVVDQELLSIPLESILADNPCGLKTKMPRS